MLGLLSPTFTRPGNVFQRSASPLGRSLDPGRVSRKPTSQFSRNWSNSSLGGASHQLPSPTAHSQYGGTPVQGSQANLGEAEGSPSRCLSGRGPTPAAGTDEREEELRRRFVRADSMLKALNPALYNYDRQMQSSHFAEGGGNGSVLGQDGSSGSPCGEPSSAMSLVNGADGRLGSRGAADFVRPPQPQGACDGVDAYDDEEQDMAIFGQIALVEQHLKKFSLQGLRTMALACRYLSQEETETYKRLYNDACASVYCRAERLEEVAEDMERDLEYLGITGVRDKLQEMVPETLQLMMEAGIRVWMVTGDNVEYALHICHSCRLLTSRTRIFHAALEFSGRKAKREGVMLYELFRKARRLKRTDEHICLVVTGPNLRTFLNHPDLQTYFLNMACCSDVVVAARVTPSQKAEMVRLVKKRLTPQPITLAIGDGGNDVAMLQEAHVGVAIRGADSAAAVAAAYADYSFSEFRFLQRLLFVHGRLSLMRVSVAILWSFFKSLCIGLPAFLFQPQAFWSAVEVYDPLLLMLVDFLWTSLPGIIHGYSDQDLPTHLLPSVPVLYTPGRRRLYFNGFRFIFWTVEGIVYSFIIFYLLQATWMEGNTFSDGQVLGFHSYGVLMLFGSLLQSNVRIILETNLWTPTFLFTTIILCTVMFFPAVLLYAATGWPRQYMELAGRVVFAWPMLYFLIPLWISIGILVQLLLHVFTSSLFPNISGAVKHYLAQKQADVDARRKATRLPFTHPRPRLLPGGHDEYGWMCGMGSCQSMLKRWAWFMGGCLCIKTPVPAEDTLGSQEFCSELRERFNPLRHKSVADRLPPPRRFRINENFLSYTSAADDKAGESAQRDSGGKGPGCGPAAAGLAGAGAAAAGRSKSVFSGAGAGGVMPMTDMTELETENSLSSNNSGRKPGDNNTKLVKVSHLINRFTLRFKDMQLEADYQIHNKKSFLKRLVPWYRVIFVFIALYQILSFLTEYFVDKHWNPRQTRMQGWMCLPTVVVELGFVAVVICTFYDFIFLDHFSLILNSIVFLMVASNFIFYAASHVDGTLTSVLFPVFTFVILRISFLQAVVWNVLFLMITILRFLVDHKYLPTLNFVHYLPLFIGVDVFVGFVGYRLEYNQRKSFLLDYSVDASRRKQREILNTMLPAFVVDQMINSELNEEGIPTSLKAEDRGTVSVIFCDVYEFQQVVASIEPTRLVEVLDSLFLCFDRSAEQFGCTKIETVFETYLAAAGLQPGKEASPATYKQDACDALDMALAMLEVAAQIRYEVKTSNPIGVGGHGALGGSGVGHGGPGKDAGHHPGALGGHMVGRQKTGNIVRTVLQSRPQRIRVKIGIHSGRVISGVVGAKKPQYALFGDTVNTASRMKTTGQPGYIHISEASYELVKDDDTLEYEPRHTEVKGKGLMNTYLLIRVKGSPYPHFDEQEGGSGDQLSDSGHPYGERRSVSRLSRRASTWSVVAGEAPTDEHGVAAGDMFAGDPAGAAGATAVAAAETLDPEAAGVANSEAQEAVLDDIVNRAVEDARVPLGSSEVEKRLQSGFRRADSGAHPGRLLSLRLSQRDSGLRPELKSFETIEEHGAAFDPKMGNRAEKRGPESSDAAGENRVRAFARRPGRGVHGRVGRDGLEEPHGEDWSDWADESEECDAKRQVESEDRGSRYCGARERVETGEVETEEEDPRIVAASTTGEGDTSSGASTTSREGAKLTPAGPGTLASLVKLEGETSMEVSRTRWKRTGVKRCTVPSRKSYEAVAVESAEVEPQWSRPGSLVRKAHTTRTGTGDRSRPSRFRTERPSKFEEVALGLLNRRKYVSEEDGDSTECQDQVRGAPVSARSRSVEKGNDPFDYTDVPVRQLVRIYQRQHRVGSVLSWVNEELRGRRPSSAPSTLALQDEQPGVGGPVSDGEDGISRGGDIRLLQRIKDALRRTPKTVGAEPSALEENSLDGTGDNSMEIPSAREGLGDMESRHCTGVTQQKLFSTDMSHGAAEEVEGEGESPGAEEPAMYEAAKAVHGDDANGQLLSRRNTKSFENDGSPAAHNKGDEEGRQLSTRHGTCPKSSGADRKGETSRRPGHHGAGSRVRTLMTFLYPQASRRTHSPDLQGTGMTAGAENEPGTEGRQPSNVDDEDLEQSRATRISVSSEWLLLKFKDKNLEARYRTHFYNNKSNINTIEQALIIFLLTFCVQTLTRLALPRVYNASPQLTVKLHVCSDLYWAVRATYTLAAFALWMLFHYRNRKEVATCLELRWMVFLLNLLFISASCVFALSNSWGVCAPGDSTSSTTSSQSQGTSETQTDQTFSVLYQDTGSVSNANTHGFVTRSLTDSSRTYTYWLLSDTIELFFYIVILHHNTGLLFQNCILVDVLLMTMSLTFITTTAKETAITVSTIATFPCYVFFNLVSAYCKEYIDRLTFYVNEHAKTTESRATQLLNDMLPKQVLEEFQQDKLKLAYLHEKVTFLFADICGFTSWAKGVDACEVVTMLQKLFAKFDKDSTKFGLYKLCTIGDAYVAVSEPVTAENAQDTDAREGMWLVLQMAKAMISNITEVRERLNIPNLNMRIGLHYGSCVGGVIGSGRLRYDLWGMDVLTGNMMESNGVPGKINVSDPLKTEIEKGFPGEFAFKFNKRVAVLESTVDSYLIRSSKELDEDEGWHIGGCIPAAAAGPVP
ncbi:guanylyl cyclase, partial [Cystoisospora suis]